MPLLLQGTTPESRGAVAQLIGGWGYPDRVKLVFLQLQLLDQAVARVGMRVWQGGHAIPPEVIARRFRAGLRNFETLYRWLVNEWQIIDNAESTPRLLSEGAQP